MLTDSPIISIVMPVYNGERYISETLSSILNQSFADFEIICINDCSTDNSLELLLSFSSKDYRIKVINTKENLGNATKVVKTIGLPNANGLYFMYLSQDDLISNDCLEKMYNKSVEVDADAVIPDFVYYDQNKKEHKKTIGLFGNRDLILSGKEAFSYSLNWEIVGAALWKTSIVKKVGYFDFNMYGDEYSVRLFFLNSSKITFCDGVFYYRIDNPNAITKKISTAFFSKVYKECLLLDLVYKNATPEVFQRSFKNFIIMFFDFKTIFLECKANFSEPQKKLVNNEFRKAFDAFQDFLKTNKVSLNKKEKSLYLKYIVLNSNYFAFIFFSNSMFLARKMVKLKNR